MTNPRGGLNDEWENWFNPVSAMESHEVDYTPREVGYLFLPDGSYLEIDMDQRPLIGFYLRDEEE